MIPVAALNNPATPENPAVLTDLTCGRDVVRDQDVGPTDEDAARRLIYLAITNARPAGTGTAALLAFKVHVGDRIPN